MADSIKTNGNGSSWIKFVIGGLITIALSIGGSLWSNGEANGTQKEKVLQLETRVDRAEKLYATDHDLLLRIDTKLQNIENILEQMQEAKNK